MSINAHSSGRYTAYDELVHCLLNSLVDVNVQGFTLVEIALKRSFICLVINKSEYGFVCNWSNMSDIDPTWHKLLGCEFPLLISN